MTDLQIGIIPWAVVLSVLAIYGARVRLKGRAQSARADRDGGSLLLSKSLMEFMMWMLTPVGHLLSRLGATADGVTWFSLVTGLGAGVALAYGRFGLATLLGLVAALCDGLDGIIARRLGTGSESGETLDAVVDRYTESAFFIGLMIHYRYSISMSALSGMALVGAFMVSYTTAKAEAQRVTPPRGLMRRSERATYMLVAAGLVPFSRALLPGTAAPLLREAPMVAAIALIGVVANASALSRTATIRHALKAGSVATSDGS